MNNGSNIVFIASQPRSGSTYLQRLLSNNQWTNTTSEPWLMLYLAPLYREDLVTAEYDNRLANKAVKLYASKFQSLNLDDIIRKTALEYYRPLMEGYEFIIDKTPRYWEILPDLKRLFPASKILVLKRNPTDVLRSMIRTWNITDLKRLNDYYRDLLIAPFRLQQFLDDSEGDDGVVSVRYEDLVSDDTVIKGLYQWLGLTYNDDVLRIEDNPKVLGHFGDPYQEKGKPKKTKEITDELMSVISGYESFLGEQFMSRYGNYEVKGAKRSVHFDMFKAGHFNDHDSISFLDKLKFKLGFNLTT